MDIAGFLRSNGPALWEGLVDHVVLTVLAVGIGFIIAFGLALLVRQQRRWLSPLAGLTGVLYTIPSLALFVMLIPVTGLSLLTAEIGLVSYTLLILLRNTVAGFDSVPREVLESADGMGYAGGQRLWRVELPIAMPLVIAGLRIATVSTIGLVMVSYVVGEGGLGQVMLRAFQLQNWPLVWASFAGMVGLAVVADALLLLALRLLTPWSRAAASR